MYTKYLSFLLFLVSIHLFPQSSSQIDIWKYLENEQVISENKEAAHSSFTSFSSKNQLKTNNSEYRKTLNGICHLNR